MPHNSAVLERPISASPGVSYDVSSIPLVTGRIATLLNGFLETLNHAPQAHVTRTEIHGWHDPEEDTAQVIVRQWVSLSSPEAAERLDAIGRAVEAWMETLPSEDKTMFVERITFQLRRDSQAYAV